MVQTLAKTIDIQNINRSINKKTIKNVIPPKVNDKILQKILKLIKENNFLPWQQPWNSAKRARNYFSERKYNGINAIFLSFVQECYRYTTPFWATYVQINKLKGRIEKGEKGFPILVPIFKKKKKKQKEHQKGKKYHFQYKNKPDFYKIKHVFNIDQCIITERYHEKFMRKYTKKDFHPITKADLIVNNFSNRPKIIHTGNFSDIAAYSPKEDKIQMPEKKCFNSSAGYYRTLFHELIHSTGHKSRLNRNLNRNLLLKEYSKEELIAEFGACYLGAKANILPSIPKNSSAYIQNWLNYLKNHKEVLINAAGFGSYAANYILGKYKKIKKERIE